MGCIANITFLNLAWPVLVMALCTGLFGWLWWQMARHLGRWCEMVDKENDFWLKRGWISKEFAEKTRRWEKSAFLRYLAAFAAIIGLTGTLITGGVWARVIWIQNQSIRMPYNPVLHPQKAQPKKPVSAAPTNLPPTKPH